MRNGNSRCCCYFLFSGLPFYPTYEEWKLNFFDWIGEKTISFLSYLWGMETWYRTIPYQSQSTFYPTYEEWKLRLSIFKFPNLFLFILPMRNGNENMASAGFKDVWLFILPMRNGNQYHRFVNIAHKYFLSYLWGMETECFGTDD